jgi:dihydrofolate reductase
LTEWRRQRESGELAALAPKKRGRKPRKNPLADELARLQRENERLRKELTKANTVIERTDFWWDNTHRIAGDLRTEVQKLKDATPAGVLLGSGKLAIELDRLDLIDEYVFLVHPRIAGHGPTLYEDGLPSTRRLELVSAKPFGNGVLAVHYRRARDSAIGHVA